MIILIIFGIWYSTIWFFGFLGLYISRTRYGKPPIPSPLEIASSAQVEGVSILRPLRGLDCNLYENLEASFRQIYPKFEIIFSVAEKDDAAIPIVQALMAKYPNVDAKLLIGEEIVGVNPKINNLIRSYRSALYDLLWILDSNVLTTTGTCARSVSLLTAAPKKGSKGIGLIHHLPFAILPADEVGARVEQVFLCSSHSKMYLAINYMEIAPCVAGKSNLFRKSDLERAVRLKQNRTGGASEGEGGLASFGEYLGEDNTIAEFIWYELGKSHELGKELAANTVGNMDLNLYFRRRVRWIRVRKFMVIASTLVEPFTEAFLLATIAAFIFSPFINPFYFIPLHLITWFSLDILIYNSLSKSNPSTARRPRHDGPGLDYLRAWFIRELLAFPIWCFAMLGNTVGWRDDGATYQVLMNGSVRLMKPGDSHGLEEWLFKKVVNGTKRWRSDYREIRLDPPPTSSH